MNRDTFEKLEYDKVKERLKNCVVSELGKDLIEKLQPSSNVKVVQKRLQETQEAKVILGLVGTVPLQGIGRIHYLIQKIEKDGILEPAELSNVESFLKGARKIKRFIQDKTFYAPLLSSYSNGIIVCEKLEEAITDAISNGKVATNASKELKRIRRHIAAEEAKIEEKLDKFLKNSNNKVYIQDFFVSKRQNHYTIPIKVSYKNQVPGVIIDSSAKGTTVFIEPSTIGKHTANLAILKAEEAVEEYKILTYLTELVYQEMDNIKLMVETIAEYDMIFAKGKYALQLDARMPEINETGEILIVGGKHPLLEGEVVPLDFAIGTSYRTLIITGPNAGGKTVVLKTIGLLTLCTQLGLHIPVKEGTKISIFDNIFVDIGDNQSLENALSTFSSHIKNISDILKQSNKATLLLFDEIGSGTEPNEGAGLASALLEAFYQKGCMTVATTHYGEIKNFSSLHPEFENAAMQFDKETLQPMYRLLIGVAGESNALWISKQMGIPQAVLEKAKQYIETKTYTFELVSENKRRKNKKEEKRVEQEIVYEIGDKVYLQDRKIEALVYKEKDLEDNIEVFYEGEIFKVPYKRVRLCIKANKLYPEGYDKNSLFISFKERKLEKDIQRGSKKALKKLEKERKENKN